ncbi:HAMP domain-containing sensor histidine kinase [soil metagenome]
MFKKIMLVRWSHRLYLRIYLAVLASLAIAAIAFGIAWRINYDPAQLGSSLETFAAIAAEVLPPATAPRELQQAALARWQPRMRADLALYSASGEKIAAVGRELPPLEASQTTSGWLAGHPPVFALKLPDDRWLVGQRIHRARRPPLGLIAALGLIALAVGIGAYPIVRRLTVRLERLQASVEALGAGQLSTRVAVEGHDEVARLAASFNRSAERIEALIEAQKTLLANASHELRSPLARIRMAVELMRSGSQEGMQNELVRNIAELDQLIDEILLASRLDASADQAAASETFDLTGMVAEECAHHGANLEAPAIEMQGDAKLLRRMVRNLLENSKRHGNDTPIDVSIKLVQNDLVQIEVYDRGPGVPANERENIFAPFYRLPGSREREGGVGLGLSLVRQIAERHGGDVECVSRDSGGSCFRVTLPT